MSKRPFSLCLFDLGNVIINFDFTAASRRLAPACGLAPEEVFRRIASWEGLVQFEEGKTTPLQFFEAMKELLNYSLKYEVFLPIWSDIFSENPAVSALIRRLLKRFPVVLVSNTNRLHFDYCHRTFPIVREIGHYALSCEVGARKPDPRIYQAALSKFAVPAQKAIYIDDLEPLVEAGKTLGLEAIHFRNAGALEKELREKGLL